MKICKTCGIEKEESQFFKKKEKWFEGTCKECKKNKLTEKESKNSEFYKEKERLRSEQRRKTDEWKEWRKDHQKRNREKISTKAIEYYHKNNNVYEKQKQWRNKNKEKFKIYIDKSNEKYPQRLRARKILNYHINIGNMTRPNKCSNCLKECKPEAHHTNYERALDVQWLCRSCHGFEHRKIKM